jgi:lysophospholipase L1-like esterase
METLVFNGDSVTDCDRIINPPYGFGYVSLLAPELTEKFNMINVGTSGDRLIDLDRRWERDVIAYSPALLSIAIGINDTWRRYDSEEITSVEDFENRYRTLLLGTRAACKSKFVLCEPFLLPAQEEMHLWREDLDPKIEVVHRLALEFEAVLVPFDAMFTKASENFSILELAEDGIHPTSLGHQLMANLWLERVLG